MKIIITESQFNNIVPLPLKRKFGEMINTLENILEQPHMGETAQQYYKGVFLDYIIEVLVYETFPDELETDLRTTEKLELYKKLTKTLFYNQIIRFWEAANSV